MARISLYAIETSHISVPITQAFELAVLYDSIIDDFDIIEFNVF